MSGGYGFNARFTRDQRTGVLVQGTIDTNGVITVTSQAGAGPPNCPICLARGTRIATPDGPVAVEALHAGMTVWTRGDGGLRVAAAVVAVGSTPVPASHHVVRLVLADGRELRASPRHPLADGRLVGTLVPGDAVDGSTVLSADREVYESDATFDLLPAGPTGTYWADGILLAARSSTHPRLPAESRAHLWSRRRASVDARLLATSVRLADERTDYYWM